MSGYNFKLTPQTVPLVSTRFRKIRTKIPVPESLTVFKKLSRYESRSMHGQLPVVWDKAEDFQVFDRYGNCWIDFTSTIFVTNSGHSNLLVLKALSTQIEQKLIHTYTFANEIRAKFLEKLIEITPSFCEKAFLLSAGTEATECAVKLMRMYGRGINRNKNIIISFKGNMHGRTMAAEMLKGDSIASAWIGYRDPNIYTLPFPYPWLKTRNWADSFKNDIHALRRQGVNFDNICGFMIESYQGWGALFYPQDYIKALGDFAKQYNILVAFDEIQGGFGRTGKLFVFEHYGIEPDLICVGKALSNGLPLSAVLGRRKIMDIPEFGSMSSTHSANPLCCAAALANLITIEKGKLVRESQRKGRILHRYLFKLKDSFPHRISGVYGRGLLAALLIKNPKDNQPDAVFASRVCEKAMQKGLLLVHTGRESVKIGPPLTITDAALNEGLKVLEETISEVNQKES